MESVEDKFVGSERLLECHMERSLFPCMFFTKATGICERFATIPRVIILVSASHFMLSSSLLANYSVFMEASGKA